MDGSSQGVFGRLGTAPVLGFYAALLIGGFAIWSWYSSGTDSDQLEGPENPLAQTLQVIDRPDPPVVRIDWLQELESSVDHRVSIQPQLQRAVRNLASYIQRSAQGAMGRPGWLADEFTATGVDTAAEQVSFQGPQLSVLRWNRSGKPPRFETAHALSDLINNLYPNLDDAAEFQVDVRVYDVRETDQGIQARLIVESNQIVDEDFTAIADTGFRKTAVQQTALWETGWRIQHSEFNDEKIARLESIRTLARETVASKMNSDVLLYDVTASVLKSSGVLESQLGYGLDQWSRSIPGMDLRGLHGVAIGDVNNDGLEDLYVCQPHGLPNLLLVQKSDGTVEDASASSQTDVLDSSSSALLLDLDNDGDQDLVVAAQDALLLFSNGGLGKFQLESKLPIGCGTSSLAAADFDRDGDLDLFLCKYAQLNRQSDLLMYPTDLQNASDGGRNVLLKNNEGFRFSDITESAGLNEKVNRGYSHSAVWHDFDQDGFPDLVIANEFGPAQLLKNEQGWFTDVTMQFGSNQVARYKSASVADFNQDGQEDVFLATDVSLAGFRVLKGLDLEKPNSGVGTERVGQSLLAESQIRYGQQDNFLKYFLRAPIFSSQTAFSSAVADLNNDGANDLLITNGEISRPIERDLGEIFFAHAFGTVASRNLPGQTNSVDSPVDRIARIAHEIADLCRAGYSLNGRQRNRCYLNIGQSGFANASGLAGFDLDDDARAVATVDWDQDGDMDVVTTCRTGPMLRILSNQLDQKTSSVVLRLQGTKSNRDAIGARAELFLDDDGAPLVQVIRAGSGNLAQSSRRVIFGIPTGRRPTSLKVTWPTGQAETFSGLERGATYDVVEGQSELVEQITDRFHLRLKQSRLAGKTDLPAAQERRLFYPRRPMATLQVQVGLDNWANLNPTTDRFRLLVFWGRNTDSDQVLKQLGDSQAKWDTDAISVSTVLIDDQHDDAEKWHYSTNAHTTYGLDIGQATLTSGSVDKLEYMFGDWFNHRQIPDPPFALLVDSDNHVCVCYDGQALRPERVHADLRLYRGSDWQYRLATSVGKGIWVANDLSAQSNRLRVRFHEVGYTEAARELNARSGRQRACELTQMAVESSSRGDLHLARRLLARAIDEDPNFASAHIELGKLLLRLSAGLGAEEAERYQAMVNAEASFKTAFDLAPWNEEAVLGIADAEIAQHRFKQAVETLDDYLDVYPERYEVQARLGRLLFEEGQIPEAAQHLSEAFDHRPNLPYLARDLGFLYLDQREDKLARKLLRYARTLQPSNPEVLRLLAQAEFVTGNFDQAVELFRQVTDSDPNRRHAKNVLAWLLATCPYNDHRDGQTAMEIITPMVKLFGNTSPSTLEIYAACFAENGNFDKAVEFQKKAIELIESPEADESYSQEQIAGLTRRLELYQSNRPYRTADLSQIPINRPTRVD